MNVNSLPENLRAAIAAAQDKLAYGITVLDLRELGAFTSYFLIVSGASTPQVQAISDEVEGRLAQRGVRTTHREGYTAGQWLLLDYGAFVVHIFHEQSRAFFDLERLWRSAKRLEIGPAGAAGSSAAQG